MFLKVYGKNPSGAHRQKVQQSKNFREGAFQNFSRTPMMSGDSGYLKMILDFLNKPKTTTPRTILPSVTTDLHTLREDKPVIVWFGHSSYFIRIEGKNFLIDPVFSGHASPFPFMIPAFNGSNVYGTGNMPAIDHLILTHDHYDHLDYKTLRLLKGKIKSIYCSMGLASHLMFWGYDAKIIHEMDWYQQEKINDTTHLRALPARHFSGRSITRNKTLWSAFILQGGKYKLFLGGDSGYDTHFKSIGDTYGPFDIALLECGQYNPGWKYIHMMPEETVQAAIDLKAKVLMPVHWAKFSLSLHPWNEPVQRVVKSAKERKLQITTPRIGEPVILDTLYPDSMWWDI